MFSRTFPPNFCIRVTTVGSLEPGAVKNERAKIVSGRNTITAKHILRKEDNLVAKSVVNVTSSPRFYLEQMD